MVTVGIKLTTDEVILLMCDDEQVAFDRIEQLNKQTTDFVILGDGTSGTVAIQRHLIAHAGMVKDA